MQHSGNFHYSTCVELSTQLLQHEPLVAIFRFDTAEKELSEVDMLTILANLINCDEQKISANVMRTARVIGRGRSRHEEARTGGSEDGEHEHGERVNAGAAASL